jgi:hypothetical protein
MKELPFSVDQAQTKNMTEETIAQGRQVEVSAKVKGPPAPRRSAPFPSA